MIEKIGPLLVALAIVVVGALLTWLAHALFGLPMCSYGAQFWGWC